jgi:ABC-type nitrate/sulfonate/bicarbonate transport system permease component
MEQTVDPEAIVPAMPRTSRLFARGSPSRSWLTRGISLSAFFLLWGVAARFDRTLLLPSPARVFAALLDLLASGELMRAFVISVQELIVGFGLGMVSGLVVGLFMAWFRPLERAISPYLYIILSVPAIAFIPLLVIWLGLGVTSRIAVVFIFSFPIIAVNAFTGMRGVDPQLVEMGQAFGLKQRQLFWKIILPGAIPLIMAGIRLGAGRAFIGMVASEILLVSVGIGGLIQYYNATFKTAYLFASVLAVLLVAVALTQLMRVVESRLSPWH